MYCDILLARILEIYAYVVQERIVNGLGPSVRRQALPAPNRHLGATGRALPRLVPLYLAIWFLKPTVYPFPQPISLRPIARVVWVCWVVLEPMQPTGRNLPVLRGRDRRRLGKRHRAIEPGPAPHPIELAFLDRQNMYCE